MEGDKNPFLSPTQYSIRKLEQGGSVVSTKQDKTLSSPYCPCLLKLNTGGCWPHECGMEEPVDCSLYWYQGDNF